MPINYGSSTFQVPGSTGNTGPQGPEGPSGPVGFTGEIGEGNSGNSGPSIVAITLDSNRFLITTFSTAGVGEHDNWPPWSGEEQLTYTSTSAIRGATGLGYIDITGSGNNSFHAGLNVQVEPIEVWKEKVNHKHIKIYSLEGTGGVELTQTSTSIDIKYDRGKFGFVGETQGGPPDRLVGYSGTGGFLVGITGATHDNMGGVDSNDGLTDIRIRNFREETLYLGTGGMGTVSDAFGGMGVTFNSTTIDGLTGYVAKIDPNKSKTFIVNVDTLTHGTLGHGPLGIFDSAPVLFEILNTIPTDELSSFTLITHGVTGTSPGWSRFTYDTSDGWASVRWPLGLEPCPSGDYGNNDIYNFFSYPEGNNNVWYGNVVKWKGLGETLGSNVLDVYACNESAQYESSTEDGERRSSTLLGGTGACCTGNGVCGYTIENLCEGYFYGAGTTCGYTGNNSSTGGICFGVGSCCIKDETTGVISCHNDIDADECMYIGDISGTSTIYGGDGTVCNRYSCASAFDEVGPCCDGDGGCLYTTKKECDEKNHFFMGLGKLCRNELGVDICSGGTGACCRQSGCEDSIGGEDCLGTGDIYAGADSKCSAMNCIRTSRFTNRDCLASVHGLDLRPGDLYAGGIVVGMFKPKGSICLGATAFGGTIKTPWTEFMSGSTGNTMDTMGLTSGVYYSRYDNHGYGFDSIDTCMEIAAVRNKDEISPNSYVIITSLEPIAITGDREVVSLLDNYGATSEFFWNNNGSSWGPMHDTSSGLYNDLNEDYKRKLRFKEGFWNNANLSGGNTLQHRGVVNLGRNTFTSCKFARRFGGGAVNKLITKPLQSFNGNWTRNYGLYNSIRMISADNALYANYNSDGNYYGSDFGPGLTADYISAIRATRLMNDGLTSDTQAGATGNIENVSGWYLPSHDELSFIAKNCVIDFENDNEFNLNNSILLNGGIPIQGWHWTSTGSFDTSENGNPLENRTGEGVLTGFTGSSPGTLAWAIKFDNNGLKEKYMSAKKKRTQNTYKVRPIRIVRCDGQYVTGGSTADNNSKLWNMPIVLRDIDKGIN